MREEKGTRLLLTGVSLIVARPGLATLLNCQKENKGVK